jgi:hypothetical protein
MTIFATKNAPALFESPARFPTHTFDVDQVIGAYRNAMIPAPVADVVKVAL